MPDFARGSKAREQIRTVRARGLKGHVEPRPGGNAREKLRHPLLARTGITRLQKSRIHAGQRNQFTQQLLGSRHVDPRKDGDLYYGLKVLLSSVHRTPWPRRAGGTFRETLPDHLLGFGVGCGSKKTRSMQRKPGIGFMS
jgi:hypothetical protein